MIIRFAGHRDSHVDQDLHAQPEGKLNERSKGLNIVERPKIVNKWQGCELVTGTDGSFALYNIH